MAGKNNSPVGTVMVTIFQEPGAFKKYNKIEMWPNRGQLKFRKKMLRVFLTVP